MTNTMRGRFEAWLEANHLVEAKWHPDSKPSFAWLAYQAAHADMLPVLGRVREALEYYALKRSTKTNLGTGEKTEYYDGDVARTALTELEAIMKEGK